jgi:hypothetical protein
VWQFQILPQLFLMGVAKLFDFRPFIRTADHRTQGDEHNVDQRVLQGVTAARIR